jgi:hypothetical protein
MSGFNQPSTTGLHQINFERQSLGSFPLTDTLRTQAPLSVWLGSASDTMANTHHNPTLSKIAAKCQLYGFTTDVYYLPKRPSSKAYAQSITIAGANAHMTSTNYCSSNNRYNEGHWMQVTCKGHSMRGQHAMLNQVLCPHVMFNSIPRAIHWLSPLEGQKLTRHP